MQKLKKVWASIKEVFLLTLAFLLGCFAFKKKGYIDGGFFWCISFFFNAEIRNQILKTTASITTTIQLYFQIFIFPPFKYTFDVFRILISRPYLVFISAARYEEIQGDLNEMATIMERTGLSRFQVNGILFLQKVSILANLSAIKVRDAMRKERVK